MSRYSGPPMTLGNAAAARVRLIVWCLDCQRQVEPAPAEMAERYGAEMTVPDWHKRLVCGQCGGRRVEFVGGRQPVDFAGASLEFGINVVPQNGALAPFKPA
jgi:Zn finger protein HypA/HybF involved in hydrogenase expression